MGGREPTPWALTYYLPKSAWAGGWCLKPEPGIELMHSDVGYRHILTDVLAIRPNVALDIFENPEKNN